MTRSRHGRSGGGPSPTGSGLPSWAQRHLDESGEPGPLELPAAPPARHRRSAPAEPSRLRGWGVAVVSVAAAVGVVPLAITSLAADHSGDPLPQVDTYTAGSPAPLQAQDGGSSAGRRDAVGAVPGLPGGDPASAGVLDGPLAPAAAAPPIVPAAPEPTAVPAAVVRTTPTTTPTRTTAPTPRSGTPTSTTETTDDTEEGRSATTSPSSSSSGDGGSDDGGGSSGGGSSDDGGGSSGDGGEQQGLLGGVLDTGGKVVGGLTGTVGGVLG